MISGVYIFHKGSILWLWNTDEHVNFDFERKSIFNMTWLCKLYIFKP